MKKWAELQTAYQVAKLGTVSAAAKELGFHRATVNRHIDALEEELGSRIFIRHARGYALTELGEQVLLTAEKTEELMKDLAGKANLEKVQIEGEIKLTILAVFYPLIMQPILDYQQNNPNCSVLVSASEDLARLDHGEAHIALRAGKKPDHPDYIVQSYRSLNFNCYAHDSYVEKYGLPKDVSDLKHHKFVMPLSNHALPYIQKWINRHVSDDQISFSSDQTEVNQGAIKAGIGLGFLNDLDVEGRTDFHPILPHNKTWQAQIWLVTHVDLHRTAKVQAMLKCLKAYNYGTLG